MKDLIIPDKFLSIILIDMNHIEKSKPQRLFYRLYPTYIQASKEQLIKVNKQSYYRVSVWQSQETQLGQMMQGASPAVLTDKIFLTKAVVFFSQKITQKGIIIKLTEHYDHDKIIGVGTFNLQIIKRKYISNNQRFYSLLECELSSNTGIFTLVFSIFVQSSKQALNEYITKFKENERQVQKSKRNINNYKRQMQKKHLFNIMQEKSKFQIEGNDGEKDNYQIHERLVERKRENTLNQFDQSPLKPPGSYLQINSAALLITNKIQKQVVRKALTKDQQVQFLAYTKIIDNFKAGSHIISAEDMETPSLISDGSEESQMRANNQKQTYSEKAVKKFKANVATFLNIIFIVISTLLIYAVIAPSKRYTRSENKKKDKNKPGQELLDLLDDD